jgi:hypothetical protein
VAVVHSFDIGRYQMLQSSTHALLLATGTTLALARFLSSAFASSTRPA